jgi:hypothetical protein
VELEGLDRLGVHRGSAVAYFEVGEIAVIELQRGTLTVAHGTSDGKPVRALVFTDGETGIPVQILLPLDGAQKIGEELAQGKLIVAKQMPS